VDAARLLQERGVTLLSLDLDDTLLDSDGVAEMRLRAALAEASRLVGEIAPDRAARALQVGITVDPVTVGRIPAFLEVLGIESESPAGVAIRAEYNRVLVDALEWIEGARDVLVRLRERFTLAVVTNGPPEMQWAKVRKFGIETLVDHVVVSGDVGHRKPDPRIFEYLFAQAGMPAQQAAHVGDSIHSDIVGARAAGMTAIWCPPKKRTPDEVGEHRPDAIIDRLAQLLGE